jgi:hypothetical protein
MGFALQFAQESAFQNDDKSWIRRREGLDDMMGVTLDLTTFTLATHYPNGFLPSGLALGKITATGLYGIYSNAALDGRQDGRGFLGSAIDMNPVPASNKSVGALFWRGTVREVRLPANHGVDAPFKVDVGPTGALVDGLHGSIRFE